MAFKLEEKFVQALAEKPVNFGFNGLGRIVCDRTYARLRDDGQKEQWYQIIERVVNGTYTIQKQHITDLHLPWNEKQAQDSAQEMALRMFDMKFLPPGRGLWTMGSKITQSKKLFAALNNCAFVSTDELSLDPIAPFLFMMDFSMLGVGVGFDCKGAGKIDIKTPLGHKEMQGLLETEEKLWKTYQAESHQKGASEKDVKAKYEKGMDAVREGFQKMEGNYITYKIEDTREGWVKSLGYLLNSYFQWNMWEENKFFIASKEGDTSYEYKTVVFDYSLVRKAGEPLKIFGGLSSGPNPLIEMHMELRKLLSSGVGQKITIRLIADIFNISAKCVVSGNLRRSSQIALGPADEHEFITLKDYNLNPERMAYGWSSNNSIFAETGMDYSKCAQLIADNGEPGFFWLNNARKYGRMCEPPNNKDHRVSGVNPCGEQSLESWELCCLVELFPTRCTDLNDFLRTIKFAYLYAKTVTLCNTHWPRCNRVMLRNRRIGCSVSGIAQFIAKYNLDTLKVWLNDGYQRIQRWDTIYSDWFCVPLSIKTTSVKPSGTVSLVAGVTPGVHYPESRFYIRRVRIGNNDPLLDNLREAGYKIEVCVGNEMTTSVVEVPVDSGVGVRSVSEVSIWEQVNLACFMQQYWADNQVSCTVTFKKEEAKEIPHVLNYAQYGLKGISFLPSFNTPSDDSEKEVKVEKEAKVFREIKHEIKDVTRNGKTESVKYELIFGMDAKGHSYSEKYEVASDGSKTRVFDRKKTPYPQMPYEKITEDEYQYICGRLRPLQYRTETKPQQDSSGEHFCDGDKCVVPKRT